MLITMEDHIARAEKFKKKAKKLRGWGLFGSKHHEIAQLLDDAAIYYKLARNWDKAKRMYIKLADHHLNIKTEHEAAAVAVVEAAHCYDVTSDDEAISCLKEGVDYLLLTEKFDASATYYKAAHLYKEIAELYESRKEIENAIEFYEKASDLFQKDGSSTSVNQCYEKAAQLATQIEKYPRAIEMYEKLVNYLLSHCKFLEHKVKGHLFNAGICKLCRGDSAVAMAKQYADLYPTFRDTWQCQSLENIAVSVDNRDLTKFYKAVEKLDDMTPLDSWANYLLSRVEDQLKASMSRRTRRKTTFADRGKQREAPTGLERSRTTIGGMSTLTEECNCARATSNETLAAKFSDAVKASRPSWTTKLLSRVEEKPRAPESVKTRWSTNKVADLTSTSFNATYGDGGKQREMCTGFSGLQRSWTMRRSPPTGSKFLRSSSRRETRVDSMGGKPAKGILQKGLMTFKRSLSMARR